MQRIAQVRGELEAQNSLIQEQLMGYRNQQLSSINLMRDQKMAALNAADQDATQRLLLARQGMSIIELMRQQSLAKQQANAAQEAVKQKAATFANRGAVLANNFRNSITPIGL